MEFVVVRFACFKSDQPMVYLISSMKYDDWLQAEPPQGYAVFDMLHTFELDRCGYEALECLTAIAGST